MFVIPEDRLSRVEAQISWMNATNQITYALSGTFVWYDIIADDGTSQITCNGTDRDVATLIIPLVGKVSLLDVLKFQTRVSLPVKIANRIEPDKTTPS